MTFSEFQQFIDRMYTDKDRLRGTARTFLWLSEEIGELAAALAEGTKEQKEEEFADVLAWLATIANIEGIDLTRAIHNKYGDGCPGCGHFVCTCNEKP